MSILIKGMSKPKTCDDCIVPLSKCEYFAKNGIDHCPLIDIVTCGECVYYEESEYIKGDMVCKYHIGHTYYTEADRYCYYGERNSKNNSNQI